MDVAEPTISAGLGSSLRALAATARNVASARALVAIVRTIP